MDLSTTKGKFMAAGLAVGATFAGLYAYSALTRKKRKGKGKKGKKAVKGALTKEETVLIFEQLNKVLTHTLARISNQEMTIRKNYQKAGQEVNTEQMYKFLQQRLEEEMAQAEPIIYSKYNTTEAAVMAATKKYGEESDLKAVMTKFQTLASTVKPPPVKIPDNLDEAKFIEIMTEMMHNITEAMRSVVNKMKEIGKDTKSLEFRAAITTQFQPAVQRISQETMTKHGIENEHVFTAAMAKFQKSPAFNAKLQQLTAEQEKEFDAMGVSGGI